MNEEQQSAARLLAYRIASVDFARAVRDLYAAGAALARTANAFDPDGNKSDETVNGNMRLAEDVLRGFVGIAPGFGDMLRTAAAKDEG